MSQAVLLHDILYFHQNPEPQEWLIYYISKPLIGTPDRISHSLQLKIPTQTENAEDTFQPKRTAIKVFDDLLLMFPIISRQMSPKLDELFQRFRNDTQADSVGRLVQPQGNSISRERPQYPRSLGSVSSLTTLGGDSSRKQNYSSDDIAIDQLRAALERLVVSAIEVFQNVDKHQLSLLGTTTAVSGAQVEKMIERHVTAQLHADFIFPKICGIKKAQDEELNFDIRQMDDIDLSQLGVDFHDSRSFRRNLTLRLTKGIDIFKSSLSSSSPQEMIEILIRTERCLTSSPSDDSSMFQDSDSFSEANPGSILTNADFLVSMLLMVIIKAQVPNLHARLLYMQTFTFLEEVETGETGYSLSTLEGVLSYISHHSKLLKHAAQANRAFWKSVKKGDLPSLRRILEQDQDFNESLSPHTGSMDEFQSGNVIPDPANHTPVSNGHAAEPYSNLQSNAHAQGESELRNAFPFEAQITITQRPSTNRTKRVSMDLRSLSSSSGQSGLSRASTLLSLWSEGKESSMERVCNARDHAGNSARMMAVEHSQISVLQYMLHRLDLFPVESFLADCNDEGTTVLSAALQVGDHRMIILLVDFLFDHVRDESLITTYLAQQDVRGRTMAHYLFNGQFLIPKLEPFLSWRVRDKNGQTPLFALCRSYDHEDYGNMVDRAITSATRSQNDGQGLNLDYHMDSKMNCLLHIVNKPHIIRRLLSHCDSDPNAKNEKCLTPLMVASKFARIDSVRVLFADERTDIQARDQRGFTAVELAKDDEIRNSMDDMVLLQSRTGSGNCLTTVVRGFLVEDGTTRFIIKSGKLNDDSTMTVTTCRRSLLDFESLAKWLKLEHPASWLPDAGKLRSPFQISSKPSRKVLRDIQMRLDGFLQILLTHPTFSTHESLWEFILVPDINLRTLKDRAQLKASTRIEDLCEDFEPLGLDMIPSIESFFSHANEQVRAVYKGLENIDIHTNSVRNTSYDLADAYSLLCGQMSFLSALPLNHVSALSRYQAALVDNRESSAITQFHYVVETAISTASALVSALALPNALIVSLHAAYEIRIKHTAAAGRSQRWPSALGLLDDTRARLMHENLEKADKARQETEILGVELNHTQETVAGELAGWQEGHALRLRNGLHTWAKGMVVRERARLESMRRAQSGIVACRS